MSSSTNTAVLLAKIAQLQMEKADLQFQMRDIIAIHKEAADRAQERQKRDAVKMNAMEEELLDTKKALRASERRNERLEAEKKMLVEKEAGPVFRNEMENMEEQVKTVRFAARMDKMKLERDGQKKDEELARNKRLIDQMTQGIMKMRIDKARDDAIICGLAQERRVLTERNRHQTPFLTSQNRTSLRRMMEMRRNLFGEEEDVGGKKKEGIKEESDDEEEWEPQTKPRLVITRLAQF